MSVARRISKFYVRLVFLWCSIITSFVKSNNKLKFNATLLKNNRIIDGVCSLRFEQWGSSKLWNKLNNNYHEERTHSWTIICEYYLLDYKMYVWIILQRNQYSTFIIPLSMSRQYRYVAEYFTLLLSYLWINMVHSRPFDYHVSSLISCVRSL